MCDKNVEEGPLWRGGDQLESMGMRTNKSKLCENIMKSITMLIKKTNKNNR